ncbi:MAG: NAD(P)H-dependent oxidoreductase subunit E [Candidatus Omnitrophota bacterium]
MNAQCLTENEAKRQDLRAYMDEIKTREYSDSYVIAILHKAQDLYGYLDKTALDEVSVYMDIPTAHLWGVATFYHYFNLTPKGKHTIAVCLGTACYIKGIQDIADAIREELKIDYNQTSEDGLFTLQEARCLGACGLAPVVMIDGKIYGRMTPKKMLQMIQQYRKQG